MNLCNVTLLEYRILGYQSRFKTDVIECRTNHASSTLNNRVYGILLSTEALKQFRITTFTCITYLHYYFIKRLHIRLVYISLNFMSRIVLSLLLFKMNYIRKRLHAQNNFKFNIACNNYLSTSFHKSISKGDNHTFIS